MIKESLNTILKIIEKNMDQLTTVAELLINLKTIDQTFKNKTKVSEPTKEKSKSTKSLSQVVILFLE